jgi:poly(3-hydroxybutyrate) depolymerase
MSACRWPGLIVLALISIPSFPVTPARAQTLPNLVTVQGGYNRLKASVKPEGDLEREIDAIDTALAEAIRQGRSGEARRLLAKGTSLLNGRPWTNVADFASSVVLRSDRLFVDPVRPFTLRIEQIYSSTLDLSAPLTARLTLRRLARSSQPATGQAQVGEVIKDFGTFEGVPRDLREAPYLADLDLSRIADGRYVVVTELSSGEQLLSARGLSIEIRKNLDARLQKLDAGSRAGGELAQALRADVLYPGDYIRRVNRGAIDPGDFDVERELSDAEATLAAINGRRDPFAGRTGEFKRHYLMPESGEIMPYHLYVPTSYGGRKRFPLVVALHGNGANEDSFFMGGARQVPEMAEERGFLVVTPLGYRVDAGYGRTTPTSSQDPALKRKRELSEADVLHVLEIVRNAYRVDEDRVYLFGHSMGAAGAWYLGAKYPDRWAALACFAGPGVPATVEQMRHIAQFVVHGDADAVVAAAESRAMVAEMKRLGVEHRYIEVPGGDHYNVLEPNVAAAFEFFDRQRRRKVTGEAGAG